MMDVEGRATHQPGINGNFKHSGVVCGPRELIVFAGETLAFLTGGRIRAPVHYVDERFPGKPRISMPFFLRAKPEAELFGGDGTKLSQVE